MSNATDMAQWLEEQFPDLTPEERFREWQLMNLEGIRDGWLKAILQANGEVLHKHIDHCSPRELQIAMTAEQYELWMEK